MQRLIGAILFVVLAVGCGTSPVSPTPVSISYDGVLWGPEMIPSAVQIKRFELVGKPMRWSDSSRSFLKMQYTYDVYATTCELDVFWDNKPDYNKFVAHKLVPIMERLIDAIDLPDTRAEYLFRLQCTHDKNSSGPDAVAYQSIVLGK